MEWRYILEKSIMGGIAAVGFAVLFNVPKRTLGCIMLAGIISVFIKFNALSININIVFSSFFSSFTVGILSPFFAHYIKAPPLTFSIPAVIPVLPGTFIYKTMIGFIQLINYTNIKNFNEIFTHTLNNGLKSTFIVMVLAVGISTPHLLLRKESLHGIKLLKKKTKNSSTH